MARFSATTTAEEVAEAFADRIAGRTFLITGPSQGSLGAYVALSLAKKNPARIVLVARNKAKIEPVIQDIVSINSGVAVDFARCDLTDLASVRLAGKTIMEDENIVKIDSVLLCAGIMNVTEYTTDKQGREVTLSACHIGHFLFTNLIMPKLLATPSEDRTGARIVSVTSEGHRMSPFRFDDWNFSEGTTYDGWSAYGQAKTSNILFAVGLARRLGARGVTAVSANPGLVLSTGLADHLQFTEETVKDMNDAALRNTGRPFQINGGPKDVSTGTSTFLYAMLDPSVDLENGNFMDACQVGTAADYALDADNAKKLWELSEDLVGQKFGN